MAIKRMDEVLAAIAAGKSNTEIREQIDGRIGDKAINQLRKHPANADVPWPEDALRYEAEQAARAETPEGARSATKGEQTEGLPTCTTAPQNARAVAEAEKAGQAAAPAVAEAEQARAEAAAAEDKVPFTPAEPEETVPEEEPEDEGPQLPECVTAMLEETDPPMSVAEAIRELALYALTDDPDHLIAAALAVKTRMHKLNKRRAKG